MKDELKKFLDEKKEIIWLKTIKMKKYNLF